MPDSSRGKRNRTGVEGKSTNRLRSSHGKSEVGSNLGSKMGGTVKRHQDSTSKLLDPQQREEKLKQEQMEEIMRKK